MPHSLNPAQISLSLTILASTLGTYIALSPPHPSSPRPTTTTTNQNDLLRSLNLTSKYSTLFTLSPLIILSLHTFLLTFFHPSIPSSLLGYVATTKRNLNTNLLTWSPATIIPLLCIFTIGIPLRLVPYASLGRNFTFALQRPSHLITMGIYTYIQHPSYLGILILVVSNVSLLGRIDGALCCWIPPRWLWGVRALYRGLIPAGAGMLMFGMWTRVLQEEGMLRDCFGGEWEGWHGRTARFLPGVF